MDTKLFSVTKISTITNFSRGYKILAVNLTATTEQWKVVAMVIF
jgi:hypothetical protein